MGDRRSPMDLTRCDGGRIRSFKSTIIGRKYAFSTHLAWVDGGRDESNKQTATRSLSVLVGVGCQSTTSHDVHM
jgi:hypothetical protein